MRGYTPHTNHIVVRYAFTTRMVIPPNVAKLYMRKNYAHTNMRDDVIGVGVY